MADERDIPEIYDQGATFKVVPGGCPGSVYFRCPWMNKSAFQHQSPPILGLNN